jgi:hypothetical protein
MHCNATIGAMRTRAAILLFALVAPGPLHAAEHPALARARALYNAADYDGAIDSAQMARTDPVSGDAAALVSARAHLEKYRRLSDPADLDAARSALTGIRAAALSPRDQVDLLIGLGQALYLADDFGAAAEIFDGALGRAAILPLRDRVLLLDWWATAVDREAQASTPERRLALLGNLVARMESELQEDPTNAPANYWLAVAVRGAGDVERAWDAAVAAWVRAPLGPATSATLRGDIDRFVTTVLVPERALTRPAQEQHAAADAYLAEWTLVKEQWK